MVEFHFEANEDAFPRRITTERLELQALDFSEVSVMEFYEAHADTPPHATTHVTFTPHQHPIEAKRVIGDAVEAFEEGNRASYAMYEKESGEWIGTTGFDADWEQDIAQSGIFLFEEYWGNGYSTERGEAMLELAFEQYDFGYWISNCSPENEKSISAIQKYVVDNGGRKVGVLPNQVKLGAEYDDILYFVLEQDAYLNTTEAV